MLAPTNTVMTATPRMSLGGRRPPTGLETPSLPNPPCGFLGRFSSDIVSTLPDAPEQLGPHNTAIMPNRQSMSSICDGFDLLPDVGS